MIFYKKYYGWNFCCIRGIYLVRLNGSRRKKLDQLWSDLRKKISRRIAPGVVEYLYQHQAVLETIDGNYFLQKTFRVECLLHTWNISRSNEWLKLDEFTSISFYLNGLLRVPVIFFLLIAMLIINERVR